MLDTDVIEEMVNGLSVDDIQLAPIQILDQNSNIFYIGRTAPKSVKDNR